MENKKHLFFVYGTLKRDEPNHDVIDNPTEGKATFVGEAKTVQKWPLIIATRYNIPCLLYSEGTGHNVVGEVYEIDSTFLAFLDKLEDHPTYYFRDAAEVKMISENEDDVKIVKPWMYFIKTFRPQLLESPFLSDYSSKGSHGLEYVPIHKVPRAENHYEEDIL